jgi:hypothetical protein
MVDYPYRPEEVDDDLRPIFEQLTAEFGKEYEIWRRVEDFGRWKSAGVVNRATRTVAIIALQTGTHSRTTRLSATELAQIRKHLISGSTEDLRL